MARATTRLLDDYPDAGTGELEFLVVDEYQDLNRSEIELTQQLAARGIHILGVGDDDQSIYGFRMAAPEGIRSFPSDFASPRDYGLTISQRCKVRILDAGRILLFDLDLPHAGPQSTSAGDYITGLSGRPPHRLSRAGMRARTTPVSDAPPCVLLVCR